VLGVRGSGVRLSGGLSHRRRNGPRCHQPRAVMRAWPPQYRRDVSSPTTRFAFRGQGGGIDRFLAYFPRETPRLRRGPDLTLLPTTTVSVQRPLHAILLAFIPKPPNHRTTWRLHHVPHQPGRCILSLEPRECCLRASLSHLPGGLERIVGAKVEDPIGDNHACGRLIAGL
jgi:hypothetical protein